MFNNLSNILRWLVILVRYDCLWVLQRITSKRFPRYIIRILFWYLPRNREVKHLAPGKRLTKALVAMGPSFIKLGQVLSVRSDLVGTDIADQLTNLQDKLPPISFVEFKKALESELNGPISQYFAHVQSTPTAAASIAQVHKATTSDNKEVAVKVLRPGIEDKFFNELNTLRLISKCLVFMFPKMSRLRLLDCINEIQHWVSLEMDLRLEAAAAYELAQNFADSHQDVFYVPKPDWTRVRKRVLTLEWIDGARIDNITWLQQHNIDVNVLLTNSAEILFLQIFRDGFFHADMHPGNILIRADGCICPLDFGIMGRLSKHLQHYLLDILTGFITRDYHKIAKAHFRSELTTQQSSLLEEFRQSMCAIGEPLFEKSLKEISISQLLLQILSVAKRFNMQARPELLLIQRTALVAEGVGRKLNPDVNIWQLAQPLISKWLKDHNHPLQKLQHKKHNLFNYAYKVDQLLEQTSLILHNLNRSQANQDNTYLSTRQLKYKRIRFIFVVLIAAAVLAMTLL